MKTVFAIFMSDLSHLMRNVIAGIVVVGLVLVPPMYAWFTTLGFWDPYSNTGNLKVAVANNDQGYQSDLLPMKVNAGEQIVSQLRANDQFDWQFVSEQEALEGVKSGAYYASLVIPADFSADLMTVFSGDVKHSEIIYYSNEKENAIAPRVTSTGASTLQEAIDKAFTETVASVALDSTSNLSDFMKGDGVVAYANNLLARMDSALGELDEAREQATSYSELLGTTASLVNASGSVLKDVADEPSAVSPLIQDARQALTGAQDSLGRTTDLLNAAAATSQKSCQKVKGAVDDVFKAASDDPAEARKLIGSLKEDVADDIAAYRTLRNAVAQASPNSTALAAIDNVIARLSALQTSLTSIEGAIDRDAQAVASARQQANQSADEAAKSIASMKSSYEGQLKEELTTLTSSLDAINDDTAKLADQLRSTAGSLGGTADSLGASIADVRRSLDDASETLGHAADELAATRDDLKHAINTGDMEEVRRIIGENPSAIASFLAAPTELNRQVVYAMPNNGSAMSAFYTSLSLWIGAIFMVALMNVNLSPKRLREIAKKVGHEPTPAQLYLGRYGVFALLALLQATIVCLGNVFFLGVQCVNFGLYLLAGWVCAIVFSNLVYTLTISFGNVGKAIAIIGLVLQLAGAGGIFPVQMSAPFFQVVYPFLPFAHSMEAFQGCIAGIYGDHYVMSLLALGGFLAGSLVLGLVLRRPVIRLNSFVNEKLEETRFL